MARTFTAIYEPADEGGYTCWVEELPGALSQGETLDEARENLKDAIRLVLEVRCELALEGVDQASLIRETIVID